MTDLSVTIMAGRLTKDAELKYTQSGTAICQFSFANNKSYKKDDEWKTDVLFIDCKIWGKYGEALSGKLLKGTSAILQGRLNQEKWETESGEKKSKFVLIVDQVQITGKGKTAGSEQGKNEPENKSGENRTEDVPTEFSDDDIPF